jgi:hypothetical protein
MLDMASYRTSSWEFLKPSIIEPVLRCGPCSTRVSLTAHRTHSRGFGLHNRHKNPAKLGPGVDKFRETWHWQVLMSEPCPRRWLRLMPASQLEAIHSSAARELFKSWRTILALWMDWLRTCETLFRISYGPVVFERSDKRISQTKSDRLEVRGSESWPALVLLKNQHITSPVEKEICCFSSAIASQVL